MRQSLPKGEIEGLTQPIYKGTSIEWAILCTGLVCLHIFGEGGEGRRRPFGLARLRRGASVRPSVEIYRR